MSEKISPRCAVFGQCGGCQYQDIPYERELALKQESLEKLFGEGQIIPREGFAPIVASPREYHYRCRLDMKFLKTRDGRTFMGFSPRDSKYLVQVESCPIAMAAISDFLPTLKKEAVDRLPPKYRNANLVVKTGDDGRVVWGGIGRRSLRMNDDDLLWTEVQGRRIFFSLDTFFQANLSILPPLIDAVRGLDVVGGRTAFFDLYGGVGLFGICLADLAAQVVLIEENIHAVRVANYNARFHGLTNFHILEGRVEDVLPQYLEKQVVSEKNVAMVDPPRAGLSQSVRETLLRMPRLDHLLYLSCHPESLVRDLKTLTQGPWQVVKVMPFDFFPRTRHLETLVLLSVRESGKSF